MSALGARTKKVTTYGKKKTRIINIHADLTPERSTAAAIASPEESPLPIRRQPLKAKLSQDVIPAQLRLAADVVAGTPLKAQLRSASCDDKGTPLKFKSAAVMPPRRSKMMGRKPLVLADDEAEPVLLKQVIARRTRRAVIPRSPSASPGRNPTAPPTLIRSRKPLRHAVPPTPLRGQVGAACDLTERLAHVSLNDKEEKKRGKQKAVEEAEVTVEPEPEPEPEASPLDRLLSVSSSGKPLPFDTFFSHPEFIGLLPEGCSSPSNPIIRKHGEASYSEVFTVSAGPDLEDVCIKVIPLLGNHTKLAAESDAELPDCSEIIDVTREIEMTKRMASVPGGGFINFLGSFVVEGVYPECLLNEWDSYKKASGSLSTRPDTFPSSQLYAIIVLPNGGTDLESFKFEQSRGWVQAAAVFWQVADALARAESWTEFEHRDLHEGQILVTPVADSAPLACVSDYLDPRATAVRTAVIDFGLSRLSLPDSGVVFSHLPKEVFDGVGDQWDVYRAMRETIGDAAGAWEAFCPSTNVLWLHYLAKRLLRATPSLRKPYARRGSATGAAPPKTAAAAKKETVRARAESAWGMMCIVERALAAGGEVPRAAGRSSRSACGKEAEKTGGFVSASSVMAWGRLQGWVGGGAEL